MDDEWDDAVALIKASSLLDAVQLVEVWLSGAKLSDWDANVNQEYRSVWPKKYVQLELNQLAA